MNYAQEITKKFGSLKTFFQSRVIDIQKDVDFLKEKEISCPLNEQERGLLIVLEGNLDLNKRLSNEMLW